MSAMPTAAPQRARCSAADLPRPRPAPVISTTCSDRSGNTSRTIAVSATFAIGRERTGTRTYHATRTAGTPLWSPCRILAARAECDARERRSSPRARFVLTSRGSRGTGCSVARCSSRQRWSRSRSSAAWRYTIAAGKTRPPRRGPCSTATASVATTTTTSPAACRSRRSAAPTSASNAKVWEAAVRKLRAGLMPPKGEPRPDRAVLDSTASWARARARRGLGAQSEPRQQAARAAESSGVRERRSATCSTTTPTRSPRRCRPTSRSADSTTSPRRSACRRPCSKAMRSRRCRSAAAPSAIARWATARRAMRLPAGSAQQRHVEGLPLGTRGGLAVEHNFPLDAEYEISVQAFLQTAGWDNPTGALVWCDGPRVELAFNGAPLALDEHRRIRLRVPAGTQRITAALVDVKRCAGRQRALSRRGRARRRDRGARDRRAVQRDGRRRHAEPPRDLRLPAELGRGRGAVRGAHSLRGSRRARSAARSQRVAPSSTRLLEFYRIGRGESGDFEVGIQYALSRLLVDPKFLYRFEREPADVAVGAASIGSPTSSSRRASPSSSGAAFRTTSCSQPLRRDRLHDPSVLEQQVERMLADPRSQRFVENFAGQWLRLRELDDFPSQDPDFDADLRDRVSPRDRAAVRGRRCARSASVRIAARRRLHVRERAPRGALRTSPACTTATCAASRCRRTARAAACSAKAACSRSTSAPNRTSPVVRGHGSCRTCSARPCRARRPAPRPTWRRKPREDQARRRHGARAARAASRESHLRRVPRDHGPARARARELRSRRPLARARGRPRGRSPRRSSTDGTRSRARRTCAARCWRAPTRSSRR